MSTLEVTATEEEAKETGSPETLGLTVLDSPCDLWLSI